MKTNKKIVIGNIKMNIITRKDREEYIEALIQESKSVDYEKLSIIMCPSLVHLENFSDNFSDNEIEIGAQNIHWESKGAYTGETSIEMVNDLGAKYSLVGHSERRQQFNETNEEVNLKVKSLLKNKMIPIFCFGEAREERNSGVTKEVISEQIADGLRDVSAADVSNIIFAYEPVWSISDGVHPAEIPTSDEIMEVKILVKKIVAEEYDEDAAEEIDILYGGSVTSENVKQACIDSGVDGVLVGGQSLDPKKFIELVNVLGE
ncbi:triose-phosphate isomerase [Patescibacteria group bacterium]